MSLREILSYVFWMVVLLAVQLLVLRNVALFGYAFGFVYLAGILMLPSDTNRTLLLFMGFGLGLLVDAFSNTLGMHAAAATLLAYLRPYWLGWRLDPRNQERVELSYRAMGLTVYVGYIVPLILIHHTMLFLVESQLGMLGYTLIRIVASTFFTVLLVWLVDRLVHR